MYIVDDNCELVVHSLRNTCIIFFHEVTWSVLTLRTHVGIPPFAHGLQPNGSEYNFKGAHISLSLNLIKTDD